MSAPAVYTIPPHVAFVDALAQGLLDRAAGDPLELARTQVLLPNRRAVRALTDAFVRRCGSGGLLLPRMTPIGDVDEDEALGGFDVLNGIDLPPAIDPTARRLMLAQAIRDWQRRAGAADPAVEALRLADQLAAAFDAIAAHELDPTALRALVADAAPELAVHWQATLAFFEILLDEWPRRLAAAGAVDAIPRRNAVLAALAGRWAAAPPAGPVVAAGMLTATPAVARLLAVIARLPRGMVVLPGLDIAMTEAEWEALACRLTAPADAPPPVESEEHPQFALKCLLARMSVARGEVAVWPAATVHDGPAARGALVAHAMAPAAFTARWQGIVVDPAAFAGVRTLEAPNAAAEAQAIALALRRQLQTPGATAALVTPDRALARRVAAHLGRWSIDIDDSAGTSLRLTPPGTLLLALAEAAAQRFTPVALLTLLKHPLVRAGAGRSDWLRQVRRLDLDLRGIRPPPGLRGIAARVGERDADPSRREPRPPLGDWWQSVAGILLPFEALFERPSVALADAVEVLRTAGKTLCGEALWSRTDGRALGETIAALAAHGGALAAFDPGDLAPLLAALLDRVAVRPAFGKQPRLAIYGTIEARLQRADLMILGGMNEGVWPPRPAPDPWLAPRLRGLLGLPGMQAGIGLAAHDFVTGLGAPQVLVTRARRDDSAPAVASRLWLRLGALAGSALRSDTELLQTADAIDAAGPPRRAARPAPAPPVALRPRQLSVTKAEQLLVDPFAFYASRMLRLEPLDALDADPSAAERGIDVHAVLEQWVSEGSRDPARLLELAHLRMAKWADHPLVGALWVPRLERAMHWAATTLTEWEADGWAALAAECAARERLANGVTLTGRADRIDRNAAGELAIIDYKTGAPPARAQVEGGFALQMGLLGWLAQRGGFGAAAPVAAFRYWKLSGGREPGKASDPLASNRVPFITPAAHIAATLAIFERLCADYLLGETPFVAKAHPEYAMKLRDFDHLARVGEWLGRPRS